MKKSIVYIVLAAVASFVIAGCGSSGDSSSSIANSAAPNTNNAGSASAADNKPRGAAPPRKALQAPPGVKTGTP